MKNTSTFIILLFSLILSSQLTLNAKTIEEKDLGCITLLQLASEKSKENEEMVKYEKLKKLQKSFLNKYEKNYFSKESTQLQYDKHNLKVEEKGQRYVNKGLQKCGLK